jgi:hypothetical protein
MGLKPPLSRGIIKKIFLISSWVLLRRSQSKIQNPKSKIQNRNDDIGVTVVTVEEQVPGLVFEDWTIQA